MRQIIIKRVYSNIMKIEYSTKYLHQCFSHKYAFRHDYTGTTMRRFFFFFPFELGYAI